MLYLAYVTPIHKKCSKNVAHNYRPTSLTLQAGRVMEAIHEEEILASLQESQIIRSSHHGFLPDRSSLTNLLTYLKYVTKNVDKRIPADTIYLDFSKAFDTVPHERLLMKMRSVWIDSNTGVHIFLDFLPICRKLSKKFWIFCEMYLYLRPQITYLINLKMNSC